MRHRNFGLNFFLQVTTAIPSEKKKRSGANLKIRSVQDRQSYRSHLEKWLTYENEDKTTVSHNWQHKKETPYQTIVSYQKM